MKIGEAFATRILGYFRSAPLETAVTVGELVRDEIKARQTRSSEARARALPAARKVVKRRKRKQVAPGVPTPGPVAVAAPAATPKKKKPGPKPGHKKRTPPAPAAEAVQS